jgi:hypothetical protein
VSYRDNPTFKLIAGCILSLVGLADIALAVSKVPLDIFRVLLGVAYLVWGASLLWKRLTA